MQTQRPRTPRGRCSAYSLVEVLVGTVLITLIIAPTFGVLKLGLKITKNARLETIASQIITTEVENLRALTYSAINTTYLAQPQPMNITNLVAEGFTNLPAGFTVSASFTTIKAFGSGNPPYGEAEATITVTYQDAFGLSKTPSTYVRFSERGLSDYVAAGF